MITVKVLKHSLPMGSEGIEVTYKKWFIIPAPLLLDDPAIKDWARHRVKDDLVNTTSQDVEIITR